MNLVKGEDDDMPDYVSVGVNDTQRRLERP
jgi:hypothetical protein